MVAGKWKIKDYYISRFTTENERKLECKRLQKKYDLFFVLFLLLLLLSFSFLKNGRLTFYAQKNL